MDLFEFFDFDLHLSWGIGSGNDRLSLIRNLVILHFDTAEVDGFGVLGRAKFDIGGLGRGEVLNVDVLEFRGGEGHVGGRGRDCAVVVVYEREHNNLGRGRKKKMVVWVGLGVGSSGDEDWIVCWGVLIY